MSNKDAAVKEADENVTEHGDGDDGDNGNLDIEFIEDDDPSPLCTWSTDPDEQCRAYVVRLMADPQYDGYILVSNMDAVYKWLRHGAIPQKNKK
jgi:hypothetical protein